MKFFICHPPNAIFPTTQLAIVTALATHTHPSNTHGNAFFARCRPSSPPTAIIIPLTIMATATAIHNTAGYRQKNCWP